MPGINLTRDEAAQRSALLSVSSYDVSLDLTTSDVTFASTTTLRFTCSEPGATTFADLVEANVREITLNGRPVDVSAYSDSRITLTDLEADNELTVVADCRYSHNGEGLHRFVDPADKLVYLYTQFEAPDARRVFPTFEQPDLKASFTSTSQRLLAGRSSPTPPRRSPWTSGWAAPSGTSIPTPPLSTYITALVAGDYAVVRDTYYGSRGDIPLGIFVRASLQQYLDSEEISRSPSRDSRTSKTSSTCRTRSASTTSCSCPSTTWARWRTPPA
jgi:aminopeptidase N